MVIPFPSLRPVHRATDPCMLARSLEATVAEAWGRTRPAWSATTPLHDARSRAAVRAAPRDLQSLAQALRETHGGDPAALQLCRALIADGFDSPLYAGDAETLRRELGRLRFRLHASEAA